MTLAPETSLSLFVLLPHLFARKRWDKGPSYGDLSFKRWDKGPSYGDLSFKRWDKGPSYRDLSFSVRLIPRRTGPLRVVCTISVRPCLSGLSDTALLACPCTHHTHTWFIHSPSSGTWAASSLICCGPTCTKSPSGLCFRFLRGRPEVGSQDRVAVPFPRRSRRAAVRGVCALPPPTARRPLAARGALCRSRDAVPGVRGGPAAVLRCLPDGQ